MEISYFGHFPILLLNMWLYLAPLNLPLIGDQVMLLSVVVNPKRHFKLNDLLPFRAQLNDLLQFYSDLFWVLGNR